MLYARSSYAAVLAAARVHRQEALLRQIAEQEEAAANAEEEKELFRIMEDSSDAGDGSLDNPDTDQYFADDSHTDPCAGASGIPGGLAARGHEGVHPPRPSLFASEPCCQKKPPCCDYFAGDVSTWRAAFVPRVRQTRAEFRLSLFEHRRASKLPCGKPYCMAWLRYWTKWSNSKLFPRSPTAKKFRRSKEDVTVVDVSVVAWFSELKQYLEKQPDTTDYHIGAPMWRCVWEWYGGRQDVAGCVCVLLTFVLQHGGSWWPT